MSEYGGVLCMYCGEPIEEWDGVWFYGDDPECECSPTGAHEPDEED